MDGRTDGRIEILHTGNMHENLCLYNESGERAQPPPCLFPTLSLFVWTCSGSQPGHQTAPSH